MKVILLLAALCLLTVGALALPFTGIYLMGFIGTGGREAGGELGLFLIVSLVGLLGGFGALRGYKALAKPERDRPQAPTE